MSSPAQREQYRKPGGAEDDVLRLSTPMGVLDCIPVPTSGTLREPVYTYPGGRLYTAHEIHTIAQREGWEMVRMPHFPKDRTPIKGLHPGTRNS